MRVIKSVVQAHLWFNSYAIELVPICYYRGNTRVQVFYSVNTTHLSTPSKQYVYD